MQDLLGTVRERYRRNISCRNLSTLTHRTRNAIADKTAEPEEKRERGFFDFLRPHLFGISKKLHEEIGKLIERREKTVLQTVNRDVLRLTERQGRQWKAETARTERTRLETAKRSEKRVELFMTDTGAKLKAVQKELDRLKAEDAARKRERDRMTNEDLPLSHRAGRKLTNDKAEREREELRREINDKAAKTERRVLRKLRDEDEYEQRRRGC
ncbi:MAG: hypothetical protein LBE16_09035 [Clostridiales Family XIII bacterium]|jgi:hypothetical protein|nr:hypothetical protein [Clostridiales Family XIII bacterium]